MRHVCVVSSCFVFCQIKTSHVMLVTPCHVLLYGVMCQVTGHVFFVIRPCDG